MLILTDVSALQYHPKSEIEYNFKTVLRSIHTVYNRLESAVVGIVINKASPIPIKSKIKSNR